MPSRENPRLIENRVVSAAAIAVFLVLLAGFAGVMLNPRITLALIDPFIRWLRPSASSADIDRLHAIARDLGHFLIPAAGFGILVIGPLRKHPVFALGLCVLFAVIDESMQNFMPGRTGSIADVIIDTSGAVFAYFAYLAIINLLKTRKYPPHGREAPRGTRQRQTQTQHR
jgi:VanZ family protein